MLVGKKHWLRTFNVNLIKFNSHSHSIGFWVSVSIDFSMCFSFAPSEFSRVFKFHKLLGKVISYHNAKLTLCQSKYPPKLSRMARDSVKIIFCDAWHVAKNQPLLWFRCILSVILRTIERWLRWKMITSNDHRMRCYQNWWDHFIRKICLAKMNSELAQMLSNHNKEYHIKSTMHQNGQKFFQFYTK